jgi:DNA mismatch repair protein MutH
LLDIVGRDSAQLKGLNVEDLGMPTTSGTMADEEFEELGIEPSTQPIESGAATLNDVILYRVY